MATKESTVERGSSTGYLFVIGCLLAGVAVLSFVVFNRGALVVAPSQLPTARVIVDRPAPRSVPTAAPQVQPAPGVYNSDAEAQAAFQAAKQAQEQAAPTPDLGPLPVNSEGEPVIDEVQQQQLNFSGEMAAAEAAQQQLNEQLQDANSRAPDVSYEDAKTLLGRDPCSVPRANPHTCARGLFKPTPVN